VPPEAVKVPEPSVSPLQFKEMSPLGVRFNNGGDVTFIVADLVQPFASVVVTLIEPTPAVVKVKVVAVVLVAPPVVLESTVKVYGAVPPEAVKVPEPFVSPLQAKAISIVVRFNTGGTVTLSVAGVVQPFASVTVTVIEPTPAFVKSNVVAVVLVLPPVVLELTVKV
jgi:hypothetical protein